MRIPDNNQIFGFIYKYGVAFAIAVVLVFIAKNFVLNIISRVSEINATSCTLSQIEEGNKLSYKGKTFTVESFDYSEWDYVGDIIRISLDENK